MAWSIGSDRCNAEAATFERAAEHPRLVLATCILASSLAFIDGSVVNVALPALGRDLHGNPAQLQWIINAYLLPLSALLLLGGALGDRFGRRITLIAGTALFALASVLCGASSSLTWLLTGRAAQGIGAALLLPNSLAILGSAFTGEARGRAVGTWSAVSAMAAAVGPVLGGWLIDHVGWRAIFFINLPPACAAITMATAFVSDPPRDGGRDRLDVLGAMLATLALAAFTWCLTVGTGRAGWSLPASAVMVTGAVLSVVFARVERDRGDRAMTPLTIFGSRSFIGLTLLTFLLYGALSGLLVLLPFVLIQGAHYSATAAGAALLPFPLVVALASPMMGSLAGRSGPRMPLTVGPLLVGAGFLLLLRLTPSGSYWTSVLPGVLVISLGMAAAVAPLTSAVLSSVDARHRGSASGLNSAVARTGGLIATALLGIVLASRGATLFEVSRDANVIGAITCVLAGITAFLLVTSSSQRVMPRKKSETQ